MSVLLLEMQDISYMPCFTESENANSKSIISLEGEELSFLSFSDGQ